ncbi:ROK family protein [Pseudarthrobacter sp. J1738]|uniref:ROK family protein n=1 Tax=Pseudarthrobacter sp. J1738 TaxID=3420446 RepID=UPI003D274316
MDSIAGLAGVYCDAFPEHHIEAMGLIVPGLVDAEAGIGIYSANLGWRDFPFGQEAEARLGVPVAFGHDVGTAGYAELEFGGAKDHRDVVILVVGTGIAAAVFAAGEPVSAGGFAGELGHALVPNPDGAGTVILESVGSAGGIARRYEGYSGRAVSGAREVSSLAMDGDPLAIRVWSQAVDALAFSISQCVSIMGTEAVVIGGGLAEAGDALLEPLRVRVDELLSFHRRPQILPAVLGQDAGILGSALRARELLARRAEGKLEQETLAEEEVSP